MFKKTSMSVVSPNPLFPSPETEETPHGTEPAYEKDIQMEHSSD